MPRIRFLLALTLVLGLWTAMAQASGMLDGTVLDPSQSTVPGASVRLFSPLSGFDLKTATDDRGRFRFSNVPFQTYVLEVAREGFKPCSRDIEVRSNLPLAVQVTLEILAQSEAVSVDSVARLTLLDTRVSGTKTRLSRMVIDKLPVGIGARGLEAVLLGFPGFASNANGSIHPRGAHNQMTYVIDGMPISDQFSGQFATSIDPNLVQNLELFTGNIPPEYGAKVSGVANVTTRSGFDGGGATFGQVDWGGGGFDTLSQSVQVGGVEGRLGWFGSVSNVKSNRFLDSPSFDNLHNGGNTQRASLRLD